MIELLVFGIFFAFMAVCLLVRVAKGPTAADRIVAVDGADNLLCCAMILFAMFSGRGIYLDIALVVALLGFISTVFVGRYIERRL